MLFFSIFYFYFHLFNGPIRLNSPSVATVEISTRTSHREHSHGAHELHSHERVEASSTCHAHAPASWHVLALFLDSELSALEERLVKGQCFLLSIFICKLYISISTELVLVSP